MKLPLHNNVRIDRRSTLKWLVATMATTQVGCGPGEQHVADDMLASLGDNALLGVATATDGISYGSDPDVMNPLFPWSKTMTESQLRLAASLSDMILPADDHSPAASTLGVHDFIDEWVSAPYPQQQSDRALILDGLEMLEQQSQRRFDSTFSSASENQKSALLDDLAYPVAGTSVPTEKIEFFQRFRFLATAAFYSTEAGTADVGYIGNVPIAGDYPGPSDEAMMHLEKILDQLGLSLDN
jgi:hypothetical protein